jgi:hypothetical protein
MIVSGELKPGERAPDRRHRHPCRAAVRDRSA